MDMNRELDRVKTKVFLGSQAAFLGSIMCSVEFEWSKDIETAETNGMKIIWNPDWFLSLRPETRCTVLLHELWHIARMHITRQGDRDPKIFNYACDIRINNDLYNEGHSFKGTEPWIMLELDDMGIIAEEDIYDYLIDNNKSPPPSGSWGVEGDSPDGDLGDDTPSPSDINDVIGAVVRATQQAELSKQAGTVPGDIKKYLDGFLNPLIPWERVLSNFFTDLTVEDFSWRRPNKRYTDMYMPSHVPNEDGLEHLCYYLDVSGSISDQQVKRFNSELKYIMDEIKPKKMTVVQFDTGIHQEDVFLEGANFDGIEVIGRGGTCLICVREHIERAKPTAAVIFTDLECAPMDKPSQEIPIIWAVLNNPHATVDVGQMLHIPYEKNL